MAEYGLMNPREERVLARDYLIWFCRHARQSSAEVEQLPVSEYHARRRSLGELLAKEWDPGDQ